MDIDACRELGLRYAVKLNECQGHEDRGGLDITDRVLDQAGRFTIWLAARPAYLRLYRAPITLQQPAYPGPAMPTKTGDNGMAVSMSDTQEVTYTVEPEDSKGIPVSDTLTWSSDDNGAVVTLTPSADSLSCLFAAVAPGTANISVTDGTLSATDAITVTAGPVASLVLTPGAPVDEPAPTA